MNVKCHPEQSARKDFPTRVVCGSGGRGVEGPLLPQKSQCGRLAQQQIWDCGRPKGSLDSALRSSLRRKTFITEARRTRSLDFCRVFSVISVVDFHFYRWVADPCDTRDDTPKNYVGS
jgi:hypothetical protein